MRPNYTSSGWPCQTHFGTVASRIHIMLQGKKITVVMPAYNAAATLERTHAEVLSQGLSTR